MATDKISSPFPHRFLLPPSSFQWSGSGVSDNRHTEREKGSLEKRENWGQFSIRSELLEAFGCDSNHFSHTQTPLDDVRLISRSLIYSTVSSFLHSESTAVLTSTTVSKKITRSAPSNMSTHFTVGVTDEMRISSKWVFFSFLLIIVDCSFFFLT